MLTPMSIVDPKHEPDVQLERASLRRDFWRSLLAGFASLEFFPHPPARTEPSDPWPDMWRDIRSDWEAVGQDIRNAADRMSS